MSGSNDALTQMLLMQARQNRRPSAQAQLAQQMMAQSSQGGPVWGTGATVARAVPGILGAFMAQQAETRDQAREDTDFRRMQEYQTQRETAANQRIDGILSRFGITPGQESPQAAPTDAPQAMPHAPRYTSTMPPNSAPDVPVPSGPVQPVASPAMRELRNDVAAQRQAVLDNPNLTPDQVQAELQRIGSGYMAAAHARVASDYAGPAVPVPRGAPVAAPQGRPAQPNYDAAALALALDPATRHLAPVVGQIATRNQTNLANASPGTTIYDQRTGRVVSTIPETETWLAPVNEGGPNGQTIRVQYSNLGNRRIVQGATREPELPSATRGPIPGGQRLNDRGELEAIPAPARQLTPGELDLKAETEDRLNGIRSARDSLTQALRLSSEAYAGPLAELRGRAVGVTGLDSNTARATTMFGSIMTEQALAQLRSIFGGNPTEGERRILLDMQASPSMSRAEREGLINRAMEAVQVRERAASGRFDAITRGEFGRVQPGGAEAPQPPPQGERPPLSSFGR